jgi:hypothetical protein
MNVFYDHSCPKYFPPIVRGLDFSSRRWISFTGQDHNLRTGVVGVGGYLRMIT